MSSQASSKTPKALPAGSLVLVTGVNGFIASHVADQFLLAGYNVRGTVRNLSKARWVNELFEKRYGEGRFETVAVEDMTKKGAYDEAIKGVSGFVHLASVVNFSPDPNEVIPTVVEGTLNALRVAAATPSIKRFVLTSSSAAVSMPIADVKYTIDQSTWNNTSLAKAWAPPPYEPDRAFDVYAASKTEGEKAAWEYVKSEKVDFVFNTVCPNCNFGEIFSDEQSGSTAGWAKGPWDGNLEFVKGFPPQYFVDVKDTARLHVAALVNSSIQNERIFAYATPFNWNDVLAIYRKQNPNRKFPEDLPGLGRDLSVVPNERGEQLLREDFGRDGWTSIEESLKENTARWK